MFLIMEFTSAAESKDGFDHITLKEHGNVVEYRYNPDQTVDVSDTREQIVVWERLTSTGSWVPDEARTIALDNARNSILTLQ